METVKFNLNNNSGKFKILNATNGGPWHKRHANDQWLTNFEAYKAARFPYSRNHDSGVVGIYGGPFSHDITRIFPDFSADVNDPASYDFACTDESISVTLDAGTKTFFRLGQTIEHHIKKHGTIPPSDFSKWAEICEHIIMHYNQGWADGFNLDMEYWEIWNEPDLDSDDAENKRTWGGTKSQFFDLYEITAKHLKSKFPNLKIGGPALAWNEQWAEEFLCEMQKRNVPIDFFSWHIYCVEPKYMIEKGWRIKDMLVKYGYENAETILNEWNYIKGWTEDYKYSINCIHGIKGAAFTLACISAVQKCDTIDMLMYYDTRPSIFCGAFDMYSYDPLKGYYPLMWYGKFYDAKYYVAAENEPKNIYTLCGVMDNGKAMATITYYTDNDNAEPKEVKIDFAKDGNYEIYVLDKNSDGELLKTTKDLTFKMEANTCMLIKEI